MMAIADSPVALKTPDVPQNYQMKVHGMTDEQVADVDKIEAVAKTMRQVDLHTQHNLHAGIYARSICIPNGVTLTGALIKIKTMLVLTGCAKVFIGDDLIEIAGYAVIDAEANRKQVIEAVTDVYMTMMFPTQATTIADCEKEFTDQWAELQTNQVA